MARGPSGMSVTDAEAQALADRILAAGDSHGSIPPITDGLPTFGLKDAYRVSALITEQRRRRGERLLGWKIGFTNRTIWEEYGVHAPIWGPMYSSTVAAIDPAAGAFACPLGHLVEPRIEPEIAFRLSVVPRPGMEEAEILACIDGVAHGIEVVQSLFPGWAFKAADTVAAFALHGCYRHGPFAALRREDRETWLAALSTFEIALFRAGAPVDVGVAANVLGGGPLTALRHLVEAAEFADGVALKPGDVVTTGTVTRAFPVAPGERWTTEVRGLPLPGLVVDFT